MFRIRSLTSEERELILTKISAELDDGGVSVYEGQKKLNHIFYELFREGKISEIDYENLKNFGSSLLWQKDL